MQLTEIEKIYITVQMYERYPGCVIESIQRVPPLAGWREGVIKNIIMPLMVELHTDRSRR